jgi:predicted nucleic acid-binding protein
MRLPQGLRGIRQLAFDSAPLIYFIERHPVYFDRMLFIMRYVDRGLIAGVASTVALAEVLVQPLRLGDDALAQRYEAVLMDSSSFHLEALTHATARRAADLRARYNLRTPDALHIATAIDAGCDAFLTNDTALKRVSEIAVLVLDDLELDPPAAP